MQASFRGFRSTLENLKRGNWVICGTASGFKCSPQKCEERQGKSQDRVKRMVNGYGFVRLIYFLGALGGFAVKD